MEITEELKKFACENSPSKLFGKLERKGLSTKKTHVENVEKIGLSLLEHQNDDAINRKLLSICLLLHDIGRAAQYDLLGEYDDVKIDHQVLAAKQIFDFLGQIASSKPDFQIGDDWKVVLDVCMLHGHRNLWAMANEISLPYLQIVADADAIENGCISAPSYLEKEKDNDAKGFIRRNPGLDQRICQSTLIEYMDQGYVFNKYELCRTYADYFVFAGTLAVSSCNKYGDVAKETMKVSGSLDEYRRIFERHLLSEDNIRVQEILSRRCV